MLGYDIRINDEGFIAAVEEGVLTMILSMEKRNKDTNISMTLAGNSISKSAGTTWIKEREVGQSNEIVIKIKNMEKPAVPDGITHLDESQRRDDRVESYYRLKSELESQGLL